MERAAPYVVDFDDFETLYVREFPSLHAVAIAMVGDANSEDIVQDTMYKALINWNRVRRLERPGAWCQKVLLNCCRGLWRRNQVAYRYRSRFVERDRWTSGPSTDVVAFWDAVRRLPSRPRMAVALYYGADRSTADVAAILGVPEGTVRSDLARARVVLADALRG